MTNRYFGPVKLSCFHTGKTPFLKLDDGTRCTSVRMDDAAALAGVSRQTLARWVAGTQAAPLAAVRLFQVAYLGLLPWHGWERFRMHRQPDGSQRLHHGEILQHWTPERVVMIAYGYDRAADLQRTVDTLRATVNALSTRQAPPLPCAEIIPISHYMQAKKSPA